MARKHPSNAVKRELRREVGFGCPICCNAFLTWHHFDPTYAERPHNDPRGMIALCGPCHDAADNGQYSKQELHRLKASHKSADDVRAQFPSWQKSSMLVRLGGIYSGGDSAIISVAGNAVISLARNEAGMLALSVDLRSEDGEPFLQMEDNTLDLYPKTIHDFEATASQSRVKLWLAPRKIGIDIHFKRITVDELNRILSEDRQRHDDEQKKRQKVHLPGLYTGEREWENIGIRERSKPPSAQWLQMLERRPKEIRESHLSDDPVGTRVRSWVTQHCLDSDGKCAFLDFAAMSIHQFGKRVHVQHGIVSEGIQFKYCSFFENAHGAINL